MNLKRLVGFCAASFDYERCGCDFGTRIIGGRVFNNGGIGRPLLDHRRSCGVIGDRSDRVQFVFGSVVVHFVVSLS
jgi:hypothetical protein